MNYTTSSNSNPSGRQGICPAGWHIPSQAEWSVLATFLGDTIVAGAKMKETGTVHWAAPNAGATNSSGFTALPGGYREHIYYDFFYPGYAALFWSTTAINADHAWNRNTYVGEDQLFSSNDPKAFGMSARCVKN
jgi:uncharacterized protein (TIGR02145 family)